MPTSTQSSPLRESLPLIQGKGQYLDDIHLPHTLHIAFVRSPYAHADILSIDCEEADAMPGVVAIFTGADIQSHLKPLNPPQNIPANQKTEWHALAINKVVYAGEPVAVVVAENRYVAEDAAEMVFVDYEPLPAVATTKDALAAGAPLLHSYMESNVLTTAKITAEKGEEAFKTADFHLSGTFQHPRVHVLSLETRGVLATHNVGTDELIVWTSTQIPHIVRDAISEHLDMPASQVRLITPHVGGGFGLKSCCYPEELLIPYLAKRLGRPVKWTQDRLEALQAGVHARDIVVEATLAANQDGSIVGIKATSYCDVGAYHVYPYGAGLDVFSIIYSLAGPYDFDYFAYEGFAVATNKCPSSAYRGVGSVLGPVIVEGLLNQLATKLGKDPLEIRRRNLARPEQFPFNSPSGATHDSGNYPALLDLAVEESGYPALRQMQKRGRENGRLLGVGLTCFVEGSASNRSAFARRGIDAVPGFDSATLNVDRYGQVIASVSIPSQGQGHYTTFAQLLAQELGVSPDKITIRLGDTATSPYGTGTISSRSLVSGGGALVKAADKLKTRLEALAAATWEIDAAQTRYQNGAVFAIDNHTLPSLSFAELAALANAPRSTLPLGFEPGLLVQAAYDPPPAVMSSGVHIALVEIDRETGFVSVPNYVVAEDCGRILNQRVVDGQVRGGVVQGVGIALFEEMHFDGEAQVLSGSLMDYLLPGTCETPNIDIIHMETPSPNTEGGYKGVAESGIIGAPATIANAILDALEVTPEHVHLPLTPERILSLIPH
ncbi:MAG: xanthine dehydrogenase family protein molybdopterin-binding subunit [Chloroflexota bacterium]